MPDLLLYFSTALAWVGVAALAWRTARPGLVPAATAVPASRSDSRPEALLVPVALILHGSLLYRQVFTAEGLDLGVANAISLMVWLTVVIYWVAGLGVEGLSGMLGLMAPVALLAVILQVSVTTTHIVSYGGSPLFTLHFAIAMLAYSLFTVATVHALVMLAEEKWLHRGVMPPFLKNLPPLLEMERLLFRILMAGFLLLTVTLVSGVFFAEQLFGKPAQFNHKTIFGVLSWLIFGGLLVGRYVGGWRGRKAVHWTLAGFIALLLAYVGYKVVLELILRRG